MRTFLFFLLLASAGQIRAQGGPPFIADDPGTPGNRHWEVNLGWIGQHTTSGGSYSTPNIHMNYGLGDRLQLKWELPLAAATDEQNTTVAGVGNSLLGVKWRPYEHYRSGEAKSDESQNFSWGFYPQAVVSNPTASVRRGVVDPGPQYYLPTEITWKLGPLNFNGEVGRWIGNRHVPDQWAKGLIAGHEFSSRFEMYGEIYDLQEIDHASGEAPGRAVTLDAGLRRSLDREGRMRLLLMGGRSIHHASQSEPDWIAYVGVQFQLGPRDEDKTK